jgi:energy-converting hydrogenase A subunit R
VSTSYEHYIRALCQAINFPFENAYCTRVNIDKYMLSQKERERLKGLAAEIVKMPIIEIPRGAQSIQDFPEHHQRTIKRLDEIFWEEIAKMKIGKIFDEVNPVGGREKAEAVTQIIKRLGIGLSDVVYVGDSITDVEAFKTVRSGGGLTISFNGNEYAVREAEIAVMSEKALVTALLVGVFCKHGKKGIINLVNNWNLKRLKELDVDVELKNGFFEAYSEKLPRVEVVTVANMEKLAKESTLFRKSVRGEAIGRLG